MAFETEGLKLEPDVIKKGVLGILEDESRGFYIVAVLGDGTIVGQLMITYEWSDWRNGNIWWIQSVYVPKEFRKQGIFRALYDHIHTMARGTSGVVALRLYIHKDNLQAQATYAKLGIPVSEYLVCENDFVLGGARSQSHKP
eukprot:CAMPEP_0184671422 /NCGR_PEP_ID=MMETSP0308-20130426/85492_1 /TAXON_ID=38269 /ORGANISM="Gloeochaete witrockiana, Strain SAG 46.84" /LENGTH=141 /DNA_ID=CAMNT_0027118547 /DNA_START=1717 /DNA_END=2142 /DNA_ORIENTATION=-